MHASKPYRDSLQHQVALIPSSQNLTDSEGSYLQTRPPTALIMSVVSARAKTLQGFVTIFWALLMPQTHCLGPHQRPQGGTFPILSKCNWFRRVISAHSTSTALIMSVVSVRPKTLRGFVTNFWARLMPQTPTQSNLTNCPLNQ